MNASHTITQKEVFEHRATLNLFSWKIHVYEKKVKQIADPSMVNAACNKLDMRIQQAMHIDEQRVLHGLR